MRMQRTSLFALLGLLLATAGAGAQTDRVFFGVLHSHTSYSDGSGTPEQAYRHARDSAGLDFLAITEHNHTLAESGAGDRADGLLIGTDPQLYEGPAATALIPTALRINRESDGRFVALYGQEYSSISKGNHVNVYEIARVIPDTVAPNGRFDELIDFLGANLDSTGQPAIIQFNHPSTRRPIQAIEYGKDDFGTDRAEWIRRMGEHASLIEILNGPGLERGTGLRPDEFREQAFLYYLNLGFRLAPTADQDNHYLNWGDLTEARTGVIADGLTREKLLDALRKRHVYATTDKNLRVIIKVNGHLFGDRIPAPAVNSPMSVEYVISDDDEPDADYIVEVFSDVLGGRDMASVSHTVSIDEGEGTGTIDDLSYTGGDQYMFFKITQVDEDDSSDTAWTAPVWFGTPVVDGTPVVVDPDSDPDDETANFVASRRSRVYHVSDECLDARSINPGNRITGASVAVGRRRHQGCPRTD